MRVSGTHILYRTHFSCLHFQMEVTLLYQLLILITRNLFIAGSVVRHFQPDLVFFVKRHGIFNVSCGHLFTLFNRGSVGKCFQCLQVLECYFFSVFIPPFFLALFFSMFSGQSHRRILFIDDLFLFLYVAEKTGQRTVPNVFVNGNHIGGNDDTHKEGSWKPVYKSEVPYSQRKSSTRKYLAKGIL